MMHVPLFFSIRWKLLSIMIVLVVSVLVVSTYLQISHQKQIFNRELALRVTLSKEKLISRGDALSKNLARQVQNALATANLSLISDILYKIVSEDSELSYAVLVDSLNRVYIHTLKSDMELEILPEQQKSKLKQNQISFYQYQDDNFSVIEFIKKIQISTEPWGTLQLAFTLDTLDKETLGFRQDNELKIQDMIKQSIYTAGGFIVFIVFIMLILTDRILRPLRRLTGAANQLAKGNFKATDKIKINSKDEVGMLSVAFINMAEDLQSSYAELQNYSETLEKKVQERTIELATARDEAVKANQSKSNFLSMVTHEIRTPMAAIIGLTKLSLKTNLDVQQRNYLSKVENSADSLLIIANDLLDLSKIEAGQFSIESTRFNLEDVLNQLTTLVEIRLKEKGLDLQYVIDDNIPLSFQGDPLRLNQILLNLVGNAIKFTEKGGVVVKIELAKDLPQDNPKLMLRFSVKDTGIGLSQTQIERIFTPFSQANSSTSRLYGGTGLGLSISKQLVELMGGTITIESVPEIGSDFIFTLCLIQNDGLLFKKKIRKNKTLDSKQGETIDKGCVGGNILVVDDNTINLEVAKALLEDEGFQVSTTKNGQQAFDMLKQAMPLFDAVLMDLRMPVMDGFDAASLIRTEACLKDIPIIALTAQASRKEREKCLNHKMQDCISKPIEMEQLLNCLNKYIKPKLLRNSCREG
ncbi:MAG: response regulator [Methylococcales bacterium]|nr:response regulator [Methylococcales bacterium]